MFFTTQHKDTIHPFVQLEYDNPLMKKMFKAKPSTAWDIVEKEVIDEIVFKMDDPMNRLMLELMARGGMRIGEVLKTMRISLKCRSYPAVWPMVEPTRKRLKTQRL